MKKFIFLLLCCLIFIPSVYAKRGCCSHHGGVRGCSSNGRTICNDGTLSPTCTCTPTSPKYIYGCMDKNAKNYNPKANRSNNSCIYYIYGCTDKNAKNYNLKAEKDDNSCTYYIDGCMDKKAKNYNKEADRDNGSCQYYKEGCTDKTAINYDASAEKDNNTCKYKSETIKLDEKSNDSHSTKNSNDGIVQTIIYLILSCLMLFKYKINKETIIAQRITKHHGVQKGILSFLYFISIFCPLIDMGILIYNLIKRVIQR